MDNQSTVVVATDPLTSDQIFSYRMPASNILAQTHLGTSISQVIVYEVSKNIAEAVLKEHGKEIIEEILKTKNDIKQEVIEKIEASIKKLIEKLDGIKLEFDKEKLCNVCLGIHRNQEEQYNYSRSYNHSFKKMTNLKYLELKQDIINNWIKEL